VTSQQLFSSNCRQLGIATDPSVARPGGILRKPLFDTKSGLA
jgi:hypothetical protein